MAKKSTKEEIIPSTKKTVVPEKKASAKPYSKSKEEDEDDLDEDEDIDSKPVKKGKPSSKKAKECPDPLIRCRLFNSFILFI